MARKSRSQLAIEYGRAVCRIADRISGMTRSTSAHDECAKLTRLGQGIIRVATEAQAVPHIKPQHIRKEDLVLVIQSLREAKLL